MNKILHETLINEVILSLEKPANSYESNKDRKLRIAYMLGYEAARKKFEADNTNQKEE